MPWSVSTPMSQRREFIHDVARGLYSMSELCIRYEISRKTGYKWVARYEAGGVDALLDQSRRPLRCPHAMSEEMAELFLATRRAHPSWGPRKLVAYLARKHEGLAWPAVSTVGELLKRHGLVEQRRRRHAPSPHPGRPTTPMDEPNAVWTTDFKGEFRLGTGNYCYPLTIVDGHSRYLLACKALDSTRSVGARKVFQQLFQSHGLPRYIRSDNGSPFATTALARLSRLSIWWIKLGITPELTEPSSPQQNGAHERMHKTLKAEATRPPSPTQRAQQSRFDAFCREYNTERPHEALGQRPPALLYAPSSRPYPQRLEEPEYPAHFENRKVRSNGCIKWRGTNLLVSHVLSGEHIALEEVNDGIWSVHFGPVLLGRMDERDGRIRGPHTHGTR